MAATTRRPTSKRSSGGSCAKYLRFDRSVRAKPGSSAKENRQGNSVRINDLPPEMLMKVFSFLDTTDLLDSVRYVSRTWDSAAKSSPVWNTQKYTVGRTCIVKQQILNTPNTGITGEDYTQKIRESIAMLENFPYIKHIVARCLNKSDTESLLKAMCQYCADVRSVTIWKCWVQDPTLLKDLFLKFRNIDTFGMTATAVVAQACIASLENYESIKSLTLRRASGRTGHILDLKPIAVGCPNLTHLTVRCFEYDPDSMAYLIKQRRNELKSLEFDADCVLEGTSLPLAECKLLERIYCYLNRQITRKFLEFICSAPCLKRLRLIQFRFISLPVVRDFFKNRSLPHLTQLDIAAFITDTDLHPTSKLSLRNLDKIPRIWRYTNNEWEKAEFFDLQNLLSMELRNCESFPDEWVEELSQCGYLEDLSFVKCSTLTNEQFEKIVATLPLKYLSITCCHTLTDDVLDIIAMKGEILKKLVLEHCEFSGSRVLHMLSQMRVDDVHIFECSHISQTDLLRMKKYVVSVEHGY